MPTVDGPGKTGSSTLPYQDDGYILPNLNLPPAAAPYTLVLANVPIVEDGVRENWETLRNKAIHFLGQKTGLTRDMFHSFKMAKRVRWLAPNNKSFVGDCLVLSFASPPLVKEILDRDGDNRRRTAGINVLPLGFSTIPKCQIILIFTRLVTLLTIH